MSHNPVIKDDDLIAIGEKYGILIDSDNVTQYKLCQVIITLEYEIEVERKKNHKQLDKPSE